VRIADARNGDLWPMPSLLRTLGSIPEALLGAATDARRAADAAVQLPGLVLGLDGHLRSGLAELRATLEGGVAGLRSDVQELGNGLEELRRHLARVEMSVEPVEGLERELRDGVAIVIARLDLLLDGIGAMRADLASTKAEIAPVDDDLAAVERAVKEMAPALGDVREEIVGLREDLSGLPLVGRRSKG
jgi:septal ring factor EnvC (AmiA/AmiB activator)